MRYRENREQTAELLRMVLPLMSRHAAGFHPLSFAVWYEYAAGTNQQLKAAVDARVAATTRLTDTDIEELFDKHVAMRDIESSMKVRARIQEVVEQVTETTQKASLEVGRYNDGLNDYQERLKRNVDRQAITEVVMELLGDTDRVRSHTTDLQHNLEVNSREARRLQGELEIAQVISNGAGQGTLLARSGGERYLLLLPGRGSAEALEQAERIRLSVERCRVRRQDSETAVATVTVSIGAVMLNGGEALAASITRAEQATALSRQEGGNRITVGGA